MAIDLVLMHELLGQARDELKNGGYLRPILKCVIPADKNILEIGAGAIPLFEKEVYKNSRILDYYSTEEIAKHFELDYGISEAKDVNFPSVDFVCKDGSLSRTVGEARFDVVYSSHALEHQPCLVSHLMEIERILAPDAIVAMLIPDKEHTFDALRQLSTTGDALYAYHSGNKLQRGKEVFEFFARKIDLNPGRKVRSEDTFCFSHTVHHAYEKFKSSISDNSMYVDIHNWVFTPKNLALILVELYMLGLTRLFPQIVSDVIGNEFMCVLNVVPTPSEDEIRILNDFRLRSCREILLP